MILPAFILRRGRISSDRPPGLKAFLHPLDKHTQTPMLSRQVWLRLLYVVWKGSIPIHLREAY
jgi:hypothetical protein